MKQAHFYLTDVFATARYAGNQLATFVDCEHVSDVEMQQIAREINFSETTFILSRTPRNGAYDVRIFTPAAEIDFAGHPTLGTAYVIRKHIAENSPQRITLSLRIGHIPVDFQDALLWMQQKEPRFEPAPEPQLIAKTLSLDLAQLDQRFPIQGVSTGLPFTIVPLKDKVALRAARVDPIYYDHFLQAAWAKGLVVFCPEGQEAGQDLSVRVFVDYLGVPEDPATGSGNGCLAAWLVRHRYLGSPKIDIRTGQGYEMGRPSELSLRAFEEAGKIRISVGGRVLSVARGVWD